MKSEPFCPSIAPCPDCKTNRKVKIYYRDNGFYRWCVSCPDHWDAIDEEHSKYGRTKEAAIRKWNKYSKNKLKYEWREEE